MATVPGRIGRANAEERFFFIMACVMAATIFTGFGLNVALGRSTFASPLIFHIHAAIFISWIALYLVQNALVMRGTIAVHRKLGWVAVILIPAMVIIGTKMVVVSLQTHGGPPFFAKNEFLIGNPALLLCFAGLASWAILVRRNTGWHRRLMFCAMALLTGPGLGRILPMPLLIPYAWWIAALVPLIFPLIAMWADKRRLGSVHPAYYAGVLAIVLVHLASMALAHSPLGYSIPDSVTDGTPGAERQMEAFFPQ